MESITEKSDGPKRASAALLTRRFLRELRRGWWIVAITIAVFIALAKFALPERGPAISTFQAQMWVGGKIQLNESKVYYEEVQSYYGTQMELMQSRSIRRRASAAVRKQLPEAPEIPVNFMVTLSPRAAIFTLTASGSDRAYVKLFLNAVMDEYLQYKREMRAQTTDLTLSSISEEMTRMDGEFDKAHDVLNAFLRTNSVAELQEQGAGAGTYLAELNRKLAELKLRSRFMNLLATNQSLDGSSLNTGESQPATAGMQSEAMRELARLEAERDELSRNLRPKHPQMIQLENEIRTQQELLRFAQKQSREELNKTLMAISLEIGNTEATIREWESRVLNASARMAEYDRLTQNVARTERLHEYLLSMVRNLDLSKHLDQETIAVLERAEAIPTQAKLRVPNMLLGGIAGLLTGIGIVLLLMFMNDCAASAEELEGRLTVRVIGQIPDVGGRKHHSTPLLLESGDLRHGFAESLKSIRSSLFYSTVKGSRPKSLLVTSALPGEGKSTVAVNLARGFAISGYRVLLVDADLRCSVLPRLLNLPSEPGLSDILQDGKAVDDSIVKTSIPNLSFLPPGRRVSNPGELFLSAVTDKFLRRIYDEYDYVVIDSVPVLAADDTTSLAPKVEGIVFVMRASTTTTRIAQRALDLLHARQGYVLGAVCNRGANEIAEYDYGVFYPLDRGRNGSPVKHVSRLNGEIARSE